MADTKITTDDLIYSDKMKSLLIPTEQEAEEDIWKKEVQKQKEDKTWIPLPPEAAKKLKDHLDAQGGSDSSTENQNFLGDAISAAASSLAGNAASLNPTGFRTDLGSPAGYVAAETKAKELAVPKDYREWFNPETGRVDYDKLNRVGIPQAVKRDVLSSALQGLLRMPSRQPLDDSNALVSKEDDSALMTLGKKVSQIGDNLMAQLPTSVGKKIWEYATGDAEKYDPKEVLMPDEAQKVGDKLREGGGKLDFGLYSVTVDPRLSLDQNLRLTSAQKIYAGSDMLVEGTNQAIIQNTALASQFLPALRAVKALDTAMAASKPGRVVSKTLGAINAVSNPLSAAAEYTAGKQAASSLAAKVKARMTPTNATPKFNLNTLPEAPTMAQQISGTAGGRIGTAGAEAALMQPIPLSEKGQESQVEQRLLGAAAGVGIGAAAEVLAKGVSSAMDYRQKQIDVKRTAKIDALLEKHPDIHGILSGEVKIDVPLDRGDVISLAARAVSKDAGVLPNVDARTLTESVIFGPKDPKVQQELDKALYLQGTSVRGELNRHNLQLLKNQIKGGAPDEMGPNAEAAIDQWELALKADEGGAPHPDADPHLTTVLMDDPTVFRNFIAEKFPDYINAFDKVAGQTSLEEMYRIQLLRMMRHVLPDVPEGLAGDIVRDSASSGLLRSFYQFYRSTPTDNASAEKKIIAVHAAHGKLAKIGAEITETARRFVEAFSTPDAYRTGQMNEVEGKLRGTKRATPENLRMAQAAAEKIDRQIAHAIETGTTISPEYTLELKKQFSGMANKEVMDDLLVGIQKFNVLQEDVAQKQQGIYSLMQKRTFVGQRARKANPTTPEEVALHRVFSSPDNIDTRLMQEMARGIGDKHLPMEPLNELLQLIPEISQHMSAAKPLPSGLLVAVQEAGERIRLAKKEVGIGTTYAVKVKEFSDALHLYSRQAGALEHVKQLALMGLQDPSQALRSGLAINRLSESIRAPAFFDHLDAVQAISQASVSKAFTNVDLPNELKMQMIAALTGDTALNLRMAENGKFGFQTAQHVLNVFESMKYINKGIVDRLDDLHLANVGKRMDREFFYGYFVNPGNIHDRAKSWELLQVNASKVAYFNQQFAEHSKEGASIWFKLRDSELNENWISARSSLALVNTAAQFQEEIRRGGQELAKNFNKDLSTILSTTFPGRTHPLFDWSSWKLNGSNGTPGFFYGMTKEGKFYLTELGQTHKTLFVDNNEAVNNALLHNDFDTFRDYFLDAHGGEELQYIRQNGPSDAAEAKTLAKAEALAFKTFHYFKDTQMGAHNISAKDWENVWKNAEYFTGLRLKVHNRVNEIINENNLRFKDLGHHLPPIEWREKYVVEPKTRSNMDLSTFQSNLYKDFDSRRSFRSSEEGQLAKADGITLGYPKDSKIPDVHKLETAANSVITYMHNNLMDASTVHIRLKLENTGVLLREVGCGASADWIFLLARHRLRQDGGNTVKGAEYVLNTMYQKLLSNRFTAGTALYAKPMVNVGLHIDRAYTSLTDMTSLIKNHGQYFTRLATQDMNPALGVWEAGGAAWRTLKYLGNDPKPQIDISPEHYGVMMHGVNGLKDAATQEMRNLIRDVTEAVTRYESGSVLAGAANTAKLHARINDFVMENFKERYEYASALSSGYLAAQKYEKLVYLIRNEGADAAYKWLTQRMPSKPLPTLWAMVRHAEEGIKAGETYTNGAARDFHSYWHTRSIGRYGALANPAYVVAMNQYLPQTFRFFSARMQNIFRYGETLQNAGQWLADKPLRSAFEIFDSEARKRSKEYGQLPQQQRTLGLLPMLYGMGTLWMLHSMSVGFRIPGMSSVREDILERQEDGFTKRMMTGWGVDLTDLSPVKIGSYKDLVQGYVTTKGNLLASGTSNAIRVLNNLATNLEALSIGQGGEDGWDLPIVESELMKRRKALDSFMDSEKVKSNLEWMKAQKDFQDQYQLYHTGLASALANHLINGLPGAQIIQTIVALADDPVVMWHTMQAINASPEEAARVDAAVPHKGVMNDLWNMVSFGNNERLLPMTDGDKAWWKRHWMDMGNTEEMADFKVSMFNRLNEEAIDMDRKLNRWAQMDEDFDIGVNIREANKRANTAKIPYKPERLDIIPDTEENQKLKAVEAILKKNKKPTQGRRE